MREVYDGGYMIIEAVIVREMMQVWTWGGVGEKDIWKMLTIISE